MSFNRDDKRSGGSRGGRDFNRRSFGGNRGGRDDRPREMFKTTCSNCGRECEVPFKPTGAKPVFCNDCFRAQNGSGDRPRNFERRDDRREARPSNGDNSQLKSELNAINAKLDKILRTLIPVAPAAESLGEAVEPASAESSVVAKEKVAAAKKVRVSKKKAAEEVVLTEETPTETPTE